MPFVRTWCIIEGILLFLESGGRRAWRYCRTFHRSGERLLQPSLLETVRAAEGDVFVYFAAAKYVSLPLTKYDRPRFVTAVTNVFEIKDAFVLRNTSALKIPVRRLAVESHRDRNFSSCSANHECTMLLLKKIIFSVLNLERRFSKPHERPTDLYTF